MDGNKMTDAYIPVKNETNCFEEPIKADNNSTIGNSTDTAPLEQDNKCNITNDFNPAQKANVLTLQITANISSNNSDDDNNIKTNETQDCTEDSQNMSDECLKKLAEINEIPKKDTVLKYVYKKNDDKLVKKHDVKSPGHPLNSLRRKRSLVPENNAENKTTHLKDNAPLIDNLGIAPALTDKGEKSLIGLTNKSENLTTDASENSPLIVNYETAHTPEGREIEVALPVYQRQTDNTIKNSALADFNIETLHEPLKKQENQNQDSASRSEEDSRESGEKKPYIRDENQSYSDESSEERVYPKRSERPNGDYTKTAKPYRDSEENKEREEYRDNSSSSEESREINENNRNSEYKKSRTPYRSSEKNIERDDYRKNPSSNEDSREVTDNDRDNSKKDSYEKYEKHPRKPKNNFEQYDDHPRKTEGSFEKYDDNPRKPVGSFEKYEDKEYPPTNKASYSKPVHSDKNPESNEKYSDSSRSVENSESKESPENSDSTEQGKYKDNEDDSRQTNDNEKYRTPEKKASSENSVINKYKNQDESGQSNESSSENSGDSESHLRNHKPSEEYNAKRHENGNNLSTPSKIQDVDLGDFSYERVQVDDKGQIVPAKEQEEIDTPNKPITNSGEDKKSEITQIPSSDIDEQLKSEIYESIKQPIRINGEIKPVVEINSENNYGETSGENSKEAFKTSPENDASLETILGTNGKVEDEQNEKIVDKKEQSKNGDVKQQFERIPKDYKHENKKEEEIQTETPSVGNTEEVQNVGTLDTFSPKDENYDEHLKFKFDDISIKLPEIKLPEDILAYTYEEPAYEKSRDNYENKKDKPTDKFFRYSDEYADESPSKLKKDNKHRDDDDHGHEYYGYYEPDNDKQNLRKKENDEEEEEEDDEGDVDLYEKFVRERFGKQGSFEKRSEKLQNEKSLPYNPKLYQTVQNILKKTAEIDKEAKKSGDPNAGYKWTLEYGENLK